MKTTDFSWNERLWVVDCLQCIHVGELKRNCFHVVLEDQSFGDKKNSAHEKNLRQAAEKTFSRFRAFRVNARNSAECFWTYAVGSSCEFAKCLMSH